jgi:transcriptional regulator with XRE-family HTH domain
MKASKRRYEFHDADLSIGRAIRMERERQNLTQEQLAERADVGTLQNISLLETGKRRFDVDSIISISKALNRDFVPMYLALHGYRRPLTTSPASGRDVVTDGSVHRHPGAILFQLDIEYPLMRGELPQDIFERRRFIRTLIKKISGSTLERLQQEHGGGIMVDRSGVRILW